MTTIHFPNLSTFIAQGLATSDILLGVKYNFLKLPCPSSHVINNRIAINEPMDFSGFQYRDNNNKVIENYFGSTVKKLNTVFIQTEIDRVNASASCSYEYTRGNYFTLVIEPKLVKRLDDSKLNSTHWSSFFAGGLKDCGYRRMSEEKIVKNVAFQ